MQRQRYPIYFTNSYRLVTFYINMLMPKLFKHVNCPANFFSAFDKPCIPLKMSMKICLCHGTVTTKAWQKCMGMVSCFGWRNGLSSQGMIFFCLGMVWLHISDVKREQWLCRSFSVHTRIKSYFSCLTTFTVMYFNWFVNMTTYHSLLWYTVSVLSFRCVECPGT